MPERTTRSGISQGGPHYTEAAATRVLLALQRCKGRKRRTTIEDLAEGTGVGPRTIRSIIRDVDGVLFVVAGDNDRGGIWIAENADEAEATTRRLRLQAHTLLQRARRRRRYTRKHLEVIQQAMVL